MFVNFNILNQLGSPAINSNTFANRPAAGQTGRLFVSTDTFEIYRDNGTTWDLIGGPGTSTITGTGTATQVAYFTSSQAIGSSANLFWDNTNSFLGIGTAAPTAGVHVVDTDAFGMYSQITTVAGTAATSVGLYAKNTTNFAGYAAIFDENTPNSASGQYPILIRHSLSSGTAAANMATGIHFGLPDDAGTERINQFSMDTTDPAAATYSSRYRFLLRNNGSAVTPFYITGTGIGVFTATPGAALDIHSTGIMAQLNSTSATANSLLAFQRSGNGLWRIGDTYNGGNNYFELHNTVLTNNAIQVLASSNEATFLSGKTYTTGNSIGIAVQHNLTIPNGTNVGLAALGGVNSLLNLTLGGSTTVANTGRQGLEGSTTISFTGAGTLTMTQGTTVRAFSALSSVYAFNGSAVGTITHLAGLRICFPDNVGSAVNITNNYALLINDQTTGTGTITYTNRWGIYQEGSSDLNYFAANTLIGTTVNNGEKLQVNGNITTSGAPNQYIKATGFISNQLGQLSNFGINDAGFYAISGGGLQFVNAGSNTVTFTSAGNVGIGTTSPQSIFHIGASAPANAGVKPYTGLSASYEGFLFDYYYNTSANNVRVFDIAALGFAVSGAGGSEMRFLTVPQTTTNTPLERMRITSGGNVGIGTTNPTTYTLAGTHLEVFGGANYGFIHNNTTTVKAFLASNESSLLTALFTFSNHPLTFGTNNTERMRITSGGNVLIGTTTDAGQKLQVSGNIYATEVETSNTIYSKSNITESSGYQLNATTIGYSSTNNYGWITAGGASARTTLLINGGGGAVEFGSTIKTGAPTGGTAAAWKLGSRVAATVVVNTTEYIEVDIGGTLYKLATVT